MGSFLPYLTILVESLPQPLASADSELSNPALGTVTQEKEGGREGDIETKGRGWGWGWGGCL